MTFLAPWLLPVAALLVAAAVWGVVVPERRRAARLAAAGLVAAQGRAGRRAPAVLAVVTVGLLGLALARPVAVVPLPRIGGTAVVAIDVSNSMSADDADPSRLAAAQSVATAFVDAQPATVDVGVVAFSNGGLAVQEPDGDRVAALAAIQRLTVGGGTSLAQAIVAALGAIVGKPVVLPDPDASTDPGSAVDEFGESASGGAGDDLGYHGSATIVVLSDGQDEAPDLALAAAALAADAGVHVDTVGIGTAAGTTVEVDGYQLATALDADLLTQVAAATGGSYHDGSAGDVATSVDLRLTTAPREVELTGALAGLAVVLLTVAGTLRLARTGRLV